MWFSSVFTAIHDLGVVSADCLMACAVAGTDLALCYCMLLHIAFLYIFILCIFLPVLVMGMVFTTNLDLIHYTICWTGWPTTSCTNLKSTDAQLALAPMRRAGLVNQLQDYGTCL